MKSRIRILSCVCALSIFLLSACTDETETVDKSDFGYEYYPLSVGKYWEYQSDSIVLRSAGTIRDTLKSYLREEITTRTITGEEDTLYTIKVYFKRLPGDEWQYQKTVFVTKSNQKIIRQEDNLAFTKLVFPLKAGVRFNHNQYFDPLIDVMIGGEVMRAMYGDWNTRIESINNDLVFKGNKVKSARIRLVDDVSTSLEKKVYYEIYIQHVGLYSKSMIFLQDNNTGPEPIEDRAIKGFYHTLTLLEHN
jgi:hypothetical protein